MVICPCNLKAAGFLEIFVIFTVLKSESYILMVVIVISFLYYVIWNCFVLVCQYYCGIQMSINTHMREQTTIKSGEWVCHTIKPPEPTHQPVKLLLKICCTCVWKWGVSSCWRAVWVFRLICEIRFYIQ